MWRWSIPAALAFIAVTGVCSDEMSNCSYMNLVNHLNLTTSNKAFSMTRPVEHWRTPTQVWLDMVLYGICDLDVKTQTVTTHIWLEMTWTNPFLKWNPWDFCGIDRLVIPGSQLWAPDVEIREDISDTGSIKACPLVTLWSQGLVTSHRRQKMTSTCRFYLYLFPFDQQQCNVTFFSTNYLDGMILSSWSEQEALSSISEMIMITVGEWYLTNMTILEYTMLKNNGTSSRLVYTISLARKPMLYVINLVLPLLVFLLLDLASFFMSGEKLSFKLTILLSISVLLLILQDMLPSTESNIPLMASYCVSVFLLVSLSLLEAIVEDFLMSLDQICNRRTIEEQPVQIQLDFQDHNGKVPTDSTTRPSDRNLLKLILDEVRTARQEIGSDITDRKPAGYFTQAAKLLHSAYFVLYVIAFTVYLVYMISEWLNGVMAPGSIDVVESTR